jgi:hypothetical protein
MKARCRLLEYGDEMTPEELDAWTLERNTWQLVQGLYTFASAFLTSFAPD